MSDPILRENAETAIRGPQPKCPVCNETVVDGEVVIFDHGDLIHVDCRQARPIPRASLEDRPPSS